MYIPLSDQSVNLSKWFKWRNINIMSFYHRGTDDLSIYKQKEQLLKSKRTVENWKKAQHGLLKKIPKNPLDL